MKARFIKLFICIYLLAAAALAWSKPWDHRGVKSSEVRETIVSE